MSKITLIPSTKEMITTLDYDAIMIGIDHFSVNMPLTFSLEELKNVPNDKEIFVVLNKNFHNKDIQPLQELLEQLKQYPIKAVVFYDISIVNLKKKMNLPYDLVWAQEHMTTNATTANFWYSFGANFTWISSELTLREVEEMMKEYKGKSMLTLFGRLSMFVSKRHLIKNYLETFSLESNSKNYTIQKEGFTYPIIDNENGTEVYSSYYLNGIEEYRELKETLDYVILNSYQVPLDKMKKVMELFRNMDDTDNGEKSKIEELVQPTSTGFLHTETIYKVKKNG